MIVAVVVLCTAHIVPLEAQSNTPNDVKAVTAAAEHFLEVFQNLDWEPFRALWVAEPTVFFPFDDTPQRVAGKEAVEARWKPFFDSRRTPDRKPPYMQIRPQQLLVQVFGDTGIVTFNLGQTPGPMGRRTLIFVRESGQWKLAHLHASTAGPR